MVKTKLVSIIIPAHVLNQELYDLTANCLKRIARGTPEPHEVILVDNASTRSLKKLESNLVRVLKNKQNEDPLLYEVIFLISG